jgi:GMP synthase (glutamine-hydrolysing)
MTVLLLDNFIDKKFSGYFCEYHCDDLETMDASKGEFPDDLDGYTHVVLSGSEDSIIESHDWVLKEMELLKEMIEKKIPVLGICYGHQLIARALWGLEGVRHRERPELGWKPITQTSDDPLFDSIPRDFIMFVSHFDEVTEVANADILAWSDECNIEALALKDSHVYGIQFHPEIDVENGKRFLEDLRGIVPDCSHQVDHALDEAQVCRYNATVFENFYRMKRG